MKLKILSLSNHEKSHTYGRRAASCLKVLDSTVKMLVGKAFLSAAERSSKCTGCTKYAAMSAASGFGGGWDKRAILIIFEVAVVSNITQGKAFVALQRPVESPLT